MHLFNSLTRKKELFIPFDNKKVKIYVCGITPYDTTHLGHAFTYIFFDVLVRYLTYKGYDVVYTQNVTDIDDDILKRAKKAGQNWKELGEYWTNHFLTDMKNLNVLPPTHYVKATDSIKEIIKIVDGLIKKDIAYKKNGTVYFNIKKFKSYGELSHLTEEQMILLSKERGADPNDPVKKNPLDFILWQKSLEGEPYWDSPWGKGRPGWHIECTAMSMRYLGERMDIHGGGHDLIYPHHESEIAQSESYTGKTPFVKYWLHTAMLMYEGEKMSKSLGNLVMVSDLLKKYSSNDIRWVLLSHHYRESWQFEYDELEKAKDKISVIEKVLKISSNKKDLVSSEKYFNKFIEAMEDDINTPQALKVVESLLHTSYLQKTLRQMLLILGFNI